MMRYANISNICSNTHENPICVMRWRKLVSLLNVWKGGNVQMSEWLFFKFRLWQGDHSPSFKIMKSVTDTLQCVMSAAAHIVSETRKFDHGLTQLLHDDLHWLDVADQVTYKLGVIMHRCRHGKTPQYLVDCCTPVTDVVGRQRLRSATQQMMVVPRHWLSTVGRRAFAVQGPMVWNSLPDDLRAQQDYESFRQRLKTWLFSSY